MAVNLFKELGDITIDFDDTENKKFIFKAEDVESPSEFIKRTYMTKFTLEEAQEHFKDNPTVKCLSDGKRYVLNSNSIHSEKYPNYPEPWIWGRNFSGKNILLYAPGKVQTNIYFKAKILKDE